MSQIAQCKLIERLPHHSINALEKFDVLNPSRSLITNGRNVVNINTEFPILKASINNLPINNVINK